MAGFLSAQRFAKKQASYAEFAARKVRARIDSPEGQTMTEEELDNLYDDEYFWLRLARYMNDQREYLLQQRGQE